ncbi:MAG: WYL domain-containing protein [Spirochaetia bacterium]|nr:WYL domain-containing protein [Spirochaetia bacterium]
MDSEKPRQKEMQQEKVVIRRIHAIDSEIRKGTYPNTRDLAELLEVGERTISRDIDEMRNFYNAPIEYDRTRNGYYYTEESFYIKDISLSEGELFSIALFERMLTGYKNTPLEAQLRSVFRKVVSCLGERTTIDSIYIRDDVTYIPESLVRIDAKVFNDVFTALRSGRVMTLSYRPLHKATYLKRTIQPYHVICHRGSWYVIAQDSYKGSPRLFAFSRMKDTKVTKQSFAVPKDFNWHDYVDEDMGVWASSRQPYDIKLRFAAEIATFASEHVWSSTQKVKQNKDGTVDVSFTTTQLPEVQRWVLGQGHTVQVLEPLELIEAVRKELSAMQKMYKK